MLALITAFFWFKWFRCFDSEAVDESGKTEFFRISAILSSIFSFGALISELHPEFNFGIKLFEFNEYNTTYTAGQPIHKVEIRFEIPRYDGHITCQPEFKVGPFHDGESNYSVLEGDIKNHRKKFLEDIKNVALKYRENSSQQFLRFVLIGSTDKRAPLYPKSNREIADARSEAVKEMLNNWYKEDAEIKQEIDKFYLSPKASKSELPSSELLPIDIVKPSAASGTAIFITDMSQDRSVSVCLTSLLYEN